MQMHRAPVAEGIAAFIAVLVLFVSGNPFMFALVLGLMITTSFAQAGTGHVNGAVTVGALVTGRNPLLQVVFILVGQSLGAYLALQVIEKGILPLSPRYSPPQFGESTVVWQAFLAEFLLTFVLAWIAYGNVRPNPTILTIGGFTVSAWVIIAALYFAGWTGAVMNPTVWFPQALMSGGINLYSIAIYVVAPCLGAAVAAVISPR